MRRVKCLTCGVFSFQHILKLHTHTQSPISAPSEERTEEKVPTKRKHKHKLNKLLGGNKVESLSLYLVSLD